jgi:hypothetical protein
MTPTSRALRTGPRALACALAAGLAVASSACGIPADDSPRAIADEGAPDDLGTEVEVGGGQTGTADLYFTRSDGEADRLVPVRREVPTGPGGAPAPATVLDALLDGPEDEEEGLATKLPNATGLASQPMLENGILVIDLTDTISGVQGDGAQLAFGQLVCTADALAGVDGVRFTREGESQQAPDGEGETDSGARTCDDYSNLIDPTVAAESGAGTDSTGAP